MSPRYFYGKSVTGQVTASGARDFSEVVERFRICQSLPITREAFLALPKAKRNELKRVSFFIPAVFRSDPADRRTENATVCNLVFLDLDEQKDGKCPAAPFVSNPASLYTALEGFNFAAHTTASSTPEKPRMRIVVDAEAIPLHLYAKAVATVGMLLGLSSVTTESKVAVQPMFLPTLFADSTDADQPLIAHRTDARAFEVSDIADNVPDEFAEPTSPRATPEQRADALFFLRAQVPEITLAIAHDALFAIDPDCSYPEWIEAAMALRHQFSRDTEEAYALFDEWSAQGEKYSSTEETKAKWDSCRSTAIGRMPVTIRSLLMRAVASGWDDKKVKDKSFTSALQWIEKAETITQLMEQGVQMILATPLLSATQEGVLLHELSKEAKKRFAYTMSVVDLRKDLARIKGEIRSRERSVEKVKEPLWAKGVCYIGAAHEFYRHWTGEKYKEASFNNSYARHLLPTEDDLRELGVPVTPTTLATPLMEPAKYALNHLKIPVIYDYAYDPSQPGETFFIEGGKKYVNTYNPTYPELDPKNAEMAGELFQKHLRNLIAESENRKILVDFLAFQVQMPGRKIRWAPVIQGVEGCGKTYLAELMKVVLGKQHIKTINGTAVTSGWNEWAFGFQLVVLEEVRVSGTSKHEIMNRMKEWITNPGIAINQKFRDTREITNITNYLLFSNHHDALALTAGDRRYFVLKSPLQSREQVLALGPQYFTVLFDLLQNYPGAIRSYLDSWEISTEFEPNGHAPRTKYAGEMINDSASDVTAAVRRALLEGDHPLVQYDIVSARVLKDILINESGLRVSDQHLAQVLRDEQMHQIGRHSFGEERHYLWVRQGVNGDAVDQAGDRLKRNLKNLCMEILFS